MPGSPESKTTCPAPSLDCSQRRSEQVDLLLAPHQWREAGAVERLEAPLSGALGYHLPTPDWLGEALEPLHPQVSILEQAAQQVPGAVRHHDGSRLCQDLDASRQVRRLANHLFLLRRALPNLVTDHHDARRNSDTGRERHAICRQSSHGPDQL